MTAGLGMPVDVFDRTGVTRKAYVVPVVKPVTTCVSNVVVAPVGAPAAAEADVNVAVERPQLLEQYSTLYPMTVSPLVRTGANQFRDTLVDDAVEFNN